MLNLGKKINKERRKYDKNVICFGCHKEEHVIHSCFLLFPYLKGTDASLYGAPLNGATLNRANGTFFKASSSTSTTLEV
jgi:hypothetical protein